MQLFETIRIENRRIFHLTYHEQRLNRSRSELFHCHDKLNLRNAISLPEDNGLYRCKVIYEKDIISTHLYPYTPQSVHSFKCIDHKIQYAHKYLDRSTIDTLYSRKNGTDEIVIVINGLVTDTSKANIAVKEGNRWLTPANPLLPGTTRQRLLDEGKIYKADITRQQLLESSSIALMNAMVQFMSIDSPQFI